MDERLPKEEAEELVRQLKADVDRTLLRANLKRSVAERLQQLVAMQRAAAEMRRAVRAARERG